MDTCSLRNIVSRDEDEYNKKPIIDWQGMAKSERLDVIFKAYDIVSRNDHSDEKKYKESEYVLSLITSNYRYNTIKEDLVLEMVENFRQQYVNLYVKRDPLLLSPLNEVGIHKFISTYIRPAEFNFPDLYYWDSLSKFISNYVTYELLEQPLELPKVIISPTTTLHWQKGDSFDISLLLASLLIGVGYDAYCVCGKARKYLTINDQSRRNCPEIVEPEENLSKNETIAFKPSKYKLKPRANMKSYFRSDDYEIPEKEQSDNNNPENSSPEISEEELEANSAQLHCWILILPGQRDIKEPFFIETSTGERREINDDVYCSVDSVWNNENYWVNMYPDLPVFKLRFELKDLERWEFIFIPDNLEDFFAVESGELGNEIFDLPVSWVGELRLSKLQYEKKYPDNEKIIVYKDVLLELFAEYHRKDLVIKKITYFQDKDHQQVKEVHTYFAHRKDNLIRRSSYKLHTEAAYSLDLKPTERIHEWFKPVRRFGNYIEGLKEIIIEKGCKREFRFYEDSRLDHLFRRIEFYDMRDMSIPYKVIQYFKGREDFLCHRAVKYDFGKINFSTQMNKEWGDLAKRLDSMNIVKMTEKFNRNMKKNANQDIYKRTFFSSENKILLNYHYGPGKITRSIRRYSDDGEFSTECVDPFMKVPSVVETIEEYNELVDAERECRLSIHKSHQEINEIIKRRKEEEENNEFITSIYDNIRNRPTHKELEEMIRQERELEMKRNRRDIIGPFIPIHGIKSVEDAQEVYIKVIEDMQAQLQLRSQILKDRSTKLQNMYIRRKEQHRKNQDMNESQEEYDQFMENLGLSIQVCLSRIEDQTVKNVEKWLEIRNEVLNDERLKKWLPHLQNMTIVNPFS